jgi:integrase
VAASTQNQALSDLLFLYRSVLRQDIGEIEHAPRAKVPHHVPVVLSPEDVRRVLRVMTGMSRLVASLLYGAGLRLLECLEIRVKDLDFDRREITVRRGKGRKDRRVMLPDTLREALRVHLECVKRQHQVDLAQGHGRVVLPEALARKFPSAPTEWRWQFVFPASRIC